MASKDLDLSVAIITHNEEANLERCLASLPAGVELVIVDSGSTDATADIAARHGARFLTHPFSHFAEQKNFALDHTTRSWVFSMDADEEMSQGLRDSLTTFIQTQSTEAAAAGFRIPRKLVFMGRELRYGKSADRPLRLFRRANSRFDGTVHEVVRLGSGQAKIWPYAGQLRHYSYRDLSDYFTRFNRYTSAVAEKHMAEAQSINMVAHVLRPWTEFLSRYVLRLGFLDGYAGYTYALISSLYTYVKYAKLVEIRRQQRWQAHGESHVAS